jgi:uncharacterized protein (UPF0332 family)
MSFDWNEYLKLAQQLEAQVRDPIRDEALLRSSLSRAYYAVYHRARDVLRHKDRKPKTCWSTHRCVIDEYKKSSDPRRKRIGVDLRQLRDDRNEADYDDVVASLGRLAKANLLIAAQTINEIDKI